MIARVWSAQTTPSQRAAYAEHLRTQVLPTLQAVDGFQGVMLLERSIPDAVEIMVLTLWWSIDAIRGFAGNNLEEAVVTDEAAALLTQFDRQVTHFEIVVKRDL
jgi:heme-degrading monooxygenase HmoA